ncbi:MAG: Nif3-like dinuclear metal center hexameric protein [Armatimonadota bacterium]
MKLSEIIPMLEDIAPPGYAVQGDRIGLQVGDPDQEIRRILVTVDITPQVIGEARLQSADLVIAHHPLIYEPLQTVRLDVYPQSLVYMLAKSGIAAYVMHTNYDIAKGGINDVLAERLGIVDPKMFALCQSKQYKLVTFVPGEAVDAVRDALAEVGAGAMGNYTRCSFQSPGTGTFMPMPGAEPYVGAVGELAKEPEFRLEVLVPQERLAKAVSAMVAAHPYEEPAYDVYPLQNRGPERGMGRYGRLRAPMTFGGFCELVRGALDTDLRASGDPGSRVASVAVLGGGGGNKIALARAKGVDVYVTGDVNHHQMIEAKAIGLNVIDATHFATERPGMVALAPRLHDLLTDCGVTVEYADDLTIAS